MSEGSPPRGPKGDARDGASGRPPILWLVGIALVVFSIYALSGPGRIDIVDGQHRFDVAYNLLSGNGLTMDDPALRPYAAVGVDGRRYASYAPGGSVLALPTLAIARLFGNGPLTLMFGFSLTSAFYGGVAALCFAGLLVQQGVNRRRVLQSTGIVALASPMWFMGTTAFHQLPIVATILAGLWIAFAAARANSLSRACLAGLVGGFATFAQESSALLVAWLALPFLLEERKWSRRVALAGACGLGAVFWLLALLWVNELRFGNLLNAAKLTSPTHPPLWGSFFQGLEILTVSPGKAVLLYAPSYALGFLGVIFALPRARALALVAAGMFATQLVFAANLSFCAGDWSWGPRYLMGMAPITLLTLPWALDGWGWGKRTLAIVSVSALVQLLSISVDHQRFFFERDLHPFFWYLQPEVYFEHSQLVARVSELSELQLQPVPETVRALRPGPYPGLATYAPFGVPSERLGQYPIFQLPRPWPLWTQLVPERFRPVDPLMLAPALLLLALVGAFAVVRGASWRGRRRASVR